MADLDNLASGERDQVFFDFTTRLSGQQNAGYTAWFPAGISAVTSASGSGLSGLWVMFLITGATGAYTASAGVTGTGTVNNFVSARWLTMYQMLRVAR